MSQAQQGKVEDPRIDLAIALKDVPPAGTIVHLGDWLEPIAIEFEAKADALSIVDDATAQSGADLAAEIRKRINAADDDRKKAKGPFAGVASAIDGIFGVGIRRMRTALQAVETKGGAYLQAKEKARVEAERAAKAEEERRRKAAEEEAANKRKDAEAQARTEAIAAGFNADEADEYAKGEGLKAAASLPAPAPVVTRVIPKQTSLRGEAGSLGLRTGFDFEVLDVAAFARAHPGLVEVKRGDTIALIRGLARSLGEGKIPEIAGLRIRATATGASRAR